MERINFCSVTRIVGLGLYLVTSTSSHAQDIPDGVIQRLDAITELLESFDERLTALEAQQVAGDSELKTEEGVNISVYGGNELALPAAAPGDQLHFLTFSGHASMPLRLSAYKQNPDTSGFVDELGGVLWQGYIQIGEPATYDVKLELGVTEGKLVVSDGQTSRYGGFDCFAEVQIGGASIGASLRGSGSAAQSVDQEGHVNFDSPGGYSVQVWQSCGAYVTGANIYPVPSLQQKAYINIAWRKEGNSRFEPFPAHRLVKEIQN